MHTQLAVSFMAPCFAAFASAEFVQKRSTIIVRINTTQEIARSMRRQSWVVTLTMLFDMVPLIM